MGESRRGRGKDERKRGRGKEAGEGVGCEERVKCLSNLLY